MGESWVARTLSSKWPVASGGRGHFGPAAEFPGCCLSCGRVTASSLTGGPAPTGLALSTNPKFKVQGFPIRTGSTNRLSFAVTPPLGGPLDRLKPELQTADSAGWIGYP